MRDDPHDHRLSHLNKIIQFEEIILPSVLLSLHNLSVNTVDYNTLPLRKVKSLYGIYSK